MPASSEDAAFFGGHEAGQNHERLVPGSEVVPQRPREDLKSRTLPERAQMVMIGGGQIDIEPCGRREPRAVFDQCRDRVALENAGQQKPAVAGEDVKPHFYFTP